MNIAIYARVSTDKQDTDNQIHALKEWAKRQQHTIVAEYVDIGSGTTGRRERMHDMFDAADRHEFEAAAVWSLDRLTREGALQTLLYLKRLTASVQFFSLQEPFLNSDQPFHDAIVAFQATIAKMERERISQRTREGLERAKRNGKSLGRPKGSKDGTKRRRSGYFKREELKRETKA